MRILVLIISENFLDEIDVFLIEYKLIIAKRDEHERICSQWDFPK